MSVFKTKAENLVELKPKLQHSKIPNLYLLNYGDWKNNRQKIVNELIIQFNGKPMAIRSSAISEDSLSQSKAGQYKTFLNIKINEIEKYISRVFKSYKNKQFENQVFIQEMVDSVIESGVIFTHDVLTGAPYVNINWIDGSDTTYVTSGKGGNLTTIFLNSPKKLNINSKYKLHINSVRELIRLYPQTPLDIEYAISVVNQKKIFWVLQVRPLKINSEIKEDNKLTDTLVELDLKIFEHKKNHPFVLGDKPIFANMPDWNPAELIGSKPKKLAFSLYQELISNEIWAYQRHNYGYRNLRSVPLVWNFIGHPYVDVRASFNSFIPETLSDHIANKLVNIYTDMLIKSPNLHDKIEFDIVLSCYFPGIKEKLNSRNFNSINKIEKKQLLEKLFDLTQNMILDQNNLIKNDILKILNLKKRNRLIIKSKISNLNKIYWLIEDCKRFGTLPFAGLARAAFISIQFLNKMVDFDVIKKEDMHNFLINIETISFEMLDEYKTLDKKKFINKYGHLRPGTFDISIDNYESNFSRYLNTKNYVLKSKSSKFNLIEVINKTKMSQVIPNDLFGMSLENLVKFFTVSIKMREYSKFIYTKNISDALELIKIVGDNYNLDKYELSHLNYNVIKNSVANSDNIESILKESIIKGKNDFDLSRLIKLPPLIFERNHIWEFEWPQFTANFITEAIVDGKIASSVDDNLKDKIVMIKNADPGFDWIFSKKIKAFITAYGGSNSHMAIRANELQIPAAIGIGEKLFDEIKNATDVKLDCLNKKISYE